MKSFLTGLATGLAVGYLTAPRPGRATRDQLTEAAHQQTKNLKEQWAKTVSQVSQLAERAKSSRGTSKPEPNLFADMEAGKLDRYLDEPWRAKNTHTNQVEHTADAAPTTAGQAADAVAV